MYISVPKPDDRNDVIQIHDMLLFVLKSPEPIHLPRYSQSLRLVSNVIMACFQIRFGDAFAASNSASEKF